MDRKIVVIGVQMISRTITGMRDKRIHEESEYVMKQQ